MLATQELAESSKLTGELNRRPLATHGYEHELPRGCNFDEDWIRTPNARTTVGLIRSALAGGTCSATICGN